MMRYLVKYGFYGSGSSAVVDLFSEYSTVSRRDT